MQIVADENIPLVREAFARLGTVRLMPGRDITYDAVRYADMLLVRSVTPVNDALLRKTRLRMVATATAGCDHIDMEAIKNANISFASSPGCNAIPVAEYAIAAILLHAERLKKPVSDLSVGVIGCGQAGTALIERLKGLSMNILMNDPPRAVAEGADGFVSLNEAMQADIVSLHVPLTREGDHVTRKLIGLPELARLKPNALFINSSRGEVVDEQALLTAATNRPDVRLALDVWAKEPYIDVALAKRTIIATPHIAGYSYDAKLRGTCQIYQACCRFLGAEMSWKYQNHLPKREGGPLTLQQSEPDDMLREAVLAVYDPRADDLALRSSLSLLTPQRGTTFDAIRKNYPERREFSSLTIDTETLAPEIVQKLRALGFTLPDSEPQASAPVEAES